MAVNKKKIESSISLIPDKLQEEFFHYSQNTERNYKHF